MTEQVRLKVKIYGEVKTMEMDYISDATQVAMDLIATGQGIPKAIFRGENLIADEAELNKIWEEEHNPSPEEPLN